MAQEELIKEVIKLTLNEVKEQGWDLLDAPIYEAVDTVYDVIKDEL